MPNPKIEIFSQILSFLKSKYKEVKYYHYPNQTNHYHLPFCTQVSVKINERRIYGWGNGIDSDEASFKAVIELFERIIFLNYSPCFFYRNKTFNKKRWTVKEISSFYPHSSNWMGNTTSGFALNTSPRKAINNAISELVERHTLLHSQLFNLKPTLTKEPLILQNYKVPNFVDLKFYKLKGPLNYYVSICFMNSPYGPYFGFGSSKILEKSLEKSFFELSPKIIHVQELKEKKCHKKSSHCGKPLHYFDNTTHSIKQEKDKSKKDIFLSVVDSSHLFKQIKGIKIARAVFPVLLSMFKGEWRNSVINTYVTKDKNYSMPKHEHFIG